MKLDPTLHSAATASLETVINRALRYDPATRLKLAKLAGKSLVIDISGTDLSLGCHFDTDSVRIVGQIDNPTTRLSGSLSALLSLALSERLNLTGSGVEAWGNTALLTDLKSIGGQLDLDWEEALNELLGDILGHQLANSARAQLGWLRSRGASGKRLLQEFLTEELRAVPAAPQLQQFSDSVDQLRLATDRLGARVERLLHKRRSPSATE
ncbi:SCP2 domain-containing protein [Pseudomaricurvus sp. HS19]|uniref:ubiquinone biosynthesis accessory factor UbiJ n=1 Tax=Pseudomaricurvus sp. HS19 TaxID=2692626 RepID=UPI001368EACF|nr:SCP2 sterol-binding domain-containing protein [Pseudomaricurvus sp. HS19]MYM63603.1 hypothetical protein [Pseudomaricurvus sp. HS19]